MVLIIVAIIGLVWRTGQNHVRRATSIKEGKDTTSYDLRSYLQPKTQLDAEEARKSESEARDRRYELKSEDRYEIERQS